MAKTDKTPRFNLKAVVKETGLKPDTLRAWERRYGLPEPNRTSGGHRLYSQFDIDTLKWLSARQEEGLSISRAADLWQQLQAEGKNPLEMYTEPVPAFVPAIPTPVLGNSIADLQHRWLTACMEFDEMQAQQILAQAFALFSVETVCFEVLRKSLVAIGEQWYIGEVTVQQEHFASALAMRQLEALLAAAPPPTRNGRILVACPPYELHTFAALLITLLLRRHGWDVVYLGANVPVERLELVITAVEPKLVILSAQTLQTASTTLDVAHLLQKLQVPLAFGGAIFNTPAPIIHHIPGYFLGQNLETVPQVVDHLIETARPSPDVAALSPEYQTALACYLENQAAIEAKVRQLSLPPALHKYLEIANRELGLNIIAALKLGNIFFIQENIEWLRGLLTNYREPLEATAVSSYLAIYYQAAQAVLDEQGEPVITWLAQVSQSEVPR